MTTSNLWRLLTLPCILGALFLIGAPEFPALDRAIKTSFAVASSEATAAPSELGVAPSQVTIAPTPVTVAPSEAGSRTVLLPLYASYVVLQALDVHSTMRALNSGRGYESNPMMAGVASRPAAFVVLKAATSAGVIYLAERVRVRSRKGAVVMMAAINTLYASIVANNYRIGGR